MQVVATTRRVLSRPGYSHKSLGAFIVTGAVQALLLICLLFFPRVAGADSFTYDDFGSTSGLTMNGSTAQNGNTIRLTPATGTAYYAGSLWASTKQSVAGGFDTRFTFDISEPDTDLQGADGIVFVIQNESVNALGAAGGSIGYASDNTTAGISNSVAIEFDTYQNQSDMKDPDGMHISVHTNGTGINNASEDYSIARTSDIPDLSDSSNHVVRITYVPGTLSVYLDDLTAPILTASLNLSTRLSLDDGKAYVGFTSALATGRENHDLVRWQFASGAPLVDVTAAMIASPYFSYNFQGQQLQTPMLVLPVYAAGNGTGNVNTWTIVDGEYVRIYGDGQASVDGDGNRIDNGWIHLTWDEVKGNHSIQVVVSGQDLSTETAEAIASGADTTSDGVVSNTVNSWVSDFHPREHGWGFDNTSAMYKDDRSWINKFITGSLNGLCVGMSVTALRRYEAGNAIPEVGIPLPDNIRNEIANAHKDGSSVFRKDWGNLAKYSSDELARTGEAEKIAASLQTLNPCVVTYVTSKKPSLSPGHAVVATALFESDIVTSAAIRYRTVAMYDPNFARQYANTTLWTQPNSSTFLTFDRGENPINGYNDYRFMMKFTGK